MYLLVYALDDRGIEGDTAGWFQSWPSAAPTFPIRHQTPPPHSLTAHPNPFTLAP